MPWHVQLDENDMVMAALEGEAAPEGFLAVVPAQDTVTKNPPLPVFLEDTGEIIDHAPQPDTVVPYAAAPGEIGIKGRFNPFMATRMMRVGEVLEFRPETPAPERQGDDIVTPICPAGSTVMVTDLAVGEVLASLVAEVDGFQETFGFDDAGTYLVQVQFPAPYLPSSYEVTL